MTTTDLYDSMRKVQEEYVSGEFHNPQATYLPFRRYLVDWMSDIGEQVSMFSEHVAEHDHSFCRCR